MIAQPQSLTIIPEAYLVGEAKQETKHEYENGKIVAMTGGIIPHSQIPANLATLIQIPSIGLGFPLSFLYENINFPDSSEYQSSYSIPK